MEKYIIDQIEQASEFIEWLKEDKPEKEINGNFITIGNEQFEFRDKTWDFVEKELQNEILEAGIKKIKENQGKIIFTTGDMFQLDADILINTVNCVGVMGKGIALAFKNKYPHMFKKYKEDCKNNLIKPGKLNFFHTNKTIINFPTKNHWRNDSKYEWVDSGLNELRDYLKEQPISYKVVIPALGCGHGKLDFKIVSKMITDKLDNLNHVIYVFSPNDSKKIKENQKLNPVIQFIDEPEDGLSDEILELVTKEPLKYTKNPYENDLIFGKDKTEGVISVEIKDDNVELYLNNGEIKTIPNKYWFVAPRSSKSGVKLDGNLHYKYITKYNSFEEFQEARGKLYKFKADFYTIFDQQESAMVYNGITFFKGLKVDDVSVLSFDIEANGLIDNETNEPIAGKEAEVYMISNTFRKDDKITRKVFSEDEYDSQEDMITAWMKFVQEMNPSVICGHNVFGYDFPYLSYVYKNETGEDLLLGRDFSEIKYNNRTSKFRKDGSQSYDYYDVKITGRQIIDTMFLAYKYDYSRKYPSYGLKAIIDFEGLVKKDRQFYDASLISKNWHIPEEQKKIKIYGADDSDDSLALYDLMIPQYFYYAQSIPKPFQKINNSATGSQINSFLVRSYLQNGHSLPKASEAERFEGAISLGNPGAWEHVEKVDVASLYPSVMITEKIYDRDKDPDGHFLEMVEYFTKERLENKRLGNETGDRYYKDLDQAQKIVINSSYGLLGAPGLLFNSPKNAALVTRVGREILQKGIFWACGYEAEKFPVLKKDGTPKLNKKTGEPKVKWEIHQKTKKGKGFQIVNVDTDSFSYTTGKKLQPDEFKEHIKELNNLYNAGIVWEDDGQYKTILVVKAKNYALKSYKKKEPVKIKGSALKATMKETALCDFIVEIMDLLLNKKKDQIYPVYNHYAQEIVADSLDISRWSSKKTLTKAILNPSRTNEERVLSAIKHKNFREGDKFRTYFSKDENMPVKLEEDYIGDHDQIKLLKKLYNTLDVFSTVIDIDVFPNYELIRNQKLLGIK